MRKWFDNLSRKLSNWMIGRYGTDELSRCLIWTGIVFLVLSMFIRVQGVASIFNLIAWILVIYAYFRVLSRNIVKRSRERDKFLRLTSGIRSWFSVLKKRWRDRKTHNYYRCPKCKTYIRVPKGRGKIAITCPKCREEFIKTT